MAEIIDIFTKKKVRAAPALSAPSDIFSGIEEACDAIERDLAEEAALMRQLRDELATGLTQARELLSRLPPPPEVAFPKAAQVAAPEVKKSPSVTALSRFFRWLKRGKAK